MPPIAVKRLYEAVYIVDPGLNEEQVSAITSRYQQLVESQGGTVEKVDVWERRKLAFEVKGRTEGIYVVMHFQGEPKVEAELRRMFQISEDQIRSMIVKPDENEPLNSRGTASPRANAAEFRPSIAPETAVTPEIEIVPESVIIPDVVNAPEIAQAESEETAAVV